MFIKAQLVLATLGAAQQVYLDAEGPTPRPQCKATRTREPEYSFTPFSHTLTDTVRYATSVPPATTTETYAEPSESLTSLVTSLSYTTWGKWDPRDNSTATADDSSGARGAGPLPSPSLASPSLPRRTRSRSRTSCSTRRGATTTSAT